LIHKALPELKAAIRDHIRCVRAIAAETLPEAFGTLSNAADSSESAFFCHLETCVHPLDIPGQENIRHSVKSNISSDSDVDGRQRHGASF
jgi:hypothetical protein